MANENFMGLGSQFVWWQGVVEDNVDPKLLGRCKVRILGWHPDADSGFINTDYLPWVHPIQPINGTSFYKCPNVGDWVIGFFRDGKAALDPVMWGILPGLVKDTLERNEKYFGRFANKEKHFQYVNDLIDGNPDKDILPVDKTVYQPQNDYVFTSNTNLWMNFDRDIFSKSRNSQYMSQRNISFTTPVVANTYGRFFDPLQSVSSGNWDGDAGIFFSSGDISNSASEIQNGMGQVAIRYDGSVFVGSTANSSNTSSIGLSNYGSSLRLLPAYYRTEIINEEGHRAYHRIYPSTSHVLQTSDAAFADSGYAYPIEMKSDSFEFETWYAENNFLTRNDGTTQKKFYMSRSANSAAGIAGILIDSGNDPFIISSNNTLQFNANTADMNVAHSFSLSANSATANITNSFNLSANTISLSASTATMNVAGQVIVNANSAIFNTPGDVTITSSSNSYSIVATFDALWAKIAELETQIAAAAAAAAAAQSAADAAQQTADDAYEAATANTP